MLTLSFLAVILKLRALARTSHAKYGNISFPASLSTLQKLFAVKAAEPSSTA